MSEQIDNASPSPSRLRRAAQVTTLVLFVATVLAVPVGQAVVDLSEEDGELQVKALFEQPPTEQNLRAFEKDLEENSLVEQEVRPLFQLARYRLLEDLGEKAMRGRDGWYFYTPGVKYLTEPYARERIVDNPNAEAGPEEPRDPLPAITDLREQLRARGIQLLVVPIPGKASIYPNKLVHGPTASTTVFNNTQRLIADLNESGVELLDLHEVFFPARSESQLYMATDTHWTGDGVKLAARAIAENLRARGWVESAKGSPRYVRRRVEVSRRGDIPQMTRIPRQEMLFPEERVVCYRVFDAETDEPYEDDDEAKVLLLGDSFSRIFQTDEPESAGLIANLAFELQQPLKSIVNDGGASTLVRQELARDLEMLAGVRAVIWAFVERDIRFGTRGWQVITLDAGAE